MFKPGPRKPRFRRCEDAPPLSITERDVLILSLVGRYRLIASHHLLRLIDGSRQHLIRRLGRLYHAGLLERPRAQLFLNDRSSRGFAYVLADDGRKLLKQRGLPHPSTLPRFRSVTSALSLAHSLRVADVVSRFESLALQRGWRFVPHEDWFGKESATARSSQIRWRVRLSDKGRRIDTAVIPDAAFALHSSSAHPAYFLIECDRGTMPLHRGSLSLSSIHRKVLAYIETRSAGRLWKRFSIPSFRVLVIAETTRRMKSLQAVTASHFRRGDSGLFLFASMDALDEADAFDAVWQRCSGLKTRLLS